jgi:hypothetical protein
VNPSDPQWRKPAPLTEQEMDEVMNRLSLDFDLLAKRNYDLLRAPEPELVIQGELPEQMLFWNVVKDPSVKFQVMGLGLSVQASSISPSSRLRLGSIIMTGFDDIREAKFIHFGPGSEIEMKVIPREDDEEDKRGWTARLTYRELRWSRKWRLWRLRRKHKGTPP